MNGIQMLLVIGSIALFSILVINTNRTLLISQEQELNSELILTATSVGKNIINEISSKAFDQATIYNPVYNIDSITAANALGPETGESAGLFNDVDDYNSFYQSVATPRAGSFDLNVTVNYVDDSNVNTILSSKSRTKRVKVAVTNPFLLDTLNLYYYKSY